MRNTLNSGQIRILIYKSHGKYVSICYELGWVEEYNSLEEAMKRTRDGLVAVLKSIQLKELNLGVINQSPPIKYRIIFHSLPIVGAFLRSLDFSFTSQPLRPYLPA